VLGLVLAAVGLYGVIAYLVPLAALLVGRSLESLLFGVSPRDPLTLAASVVVLAVIGAVASLVPSRRASRIDPTRALAES